MTFFKAAGTYKVLLIISFVSLFAVSCGKKTEPVSKDMLERASLPEKVIVASTDSGVLITNNEDAFVLVEKAVYQGSECSAYTRLTIVDPKEKFLDKDVAKDSRYSYRLTAKTIQYGLVSEPMLKPLTYSPPPQVANAQFIDGKLTVKASSEFIRMDVFAGEKSIVQTGRTEADIPAEELTDTLTIVLTDKYGNKGGAFTVSTAKKPVLPNVTGTGAVLFAKDLRVFWNSLRLPVSYKVTVCENASCETFITDLPYVIYQKQFDKCLDIAVQATLGEAASAPSAIKFCR